MALGGLTGYGSAPGSEDVLPMVGQVAGSLGGFSGSVAGAAGGQGARQLIRGIRGYREPLKRSLSDDLKGFAVSGPGGMKGPVRNEVLGTAAFEGGARALGAVAKPAANRLMNSVIKPGIRVLKRNPNFGVDALEAGIHGTRGQMLSKAEGLIDEGENALSSALKNRAGQVDGAQIAGELEALKRPFVNVGDDASVEAIEQVQKTLAAKGKIGLEEANQLKRDLYKVVKENSYGKGVGEISSKQTAMKAAAGKLKRGIEAGAPETQAINKRIGVGVTAKEALENELANSGRRVILPKLAGMGAGAAALSGNPLAAAGILLGDRGVDLLRTAPFVTGLAKNALRARRTLKPAALLMSEGARRLG